MPDGCILATYCGSDCLHPRVSRYVCQKYRFNMMSIVIMISTLQYRWDFKSLWKIHLKGKNENINCDSYHKCPECSCPSPYHSIMAKLILET